MGASMVAHRLWEQTGRSDWSAIVREQGFDGLDVMAMTWEDVRSIAGIDRAFLEAMIGLRDTLTRPIAELVRTLRENADDAACWAEAQTLLRAGFAAGPQQCDDARRLVDVGDVVKRFRQTGDKCVRERPDPGSPKNSPSQTQICKSDFVACSEKHIWLSHRRP
jgi:hypothetical protein